MKSNNNAHEYDNTFYVYQRDGSLRSAVELVSSIFEWLKPKSVLDVGCGAGAWLKAHNLGGVFDVVGVDGEYVDRSVLLFDKNSFIARDVTLPLHLNRTFDLVQCLEVGEHLPTEMSDTLVQNLVRHGSMIMFSAAPPGQGGENHINEQSYDFWRDLFDSHGYDLYDFIRPTVFMNKKIESWYRYNILFFVKRGEEIRLPEYIQKSKVNISSAVKDYAPFSYRIRRKIVAHLPLKVVTYIAVLKSRYIAWRLRQDG